MAKFIMKTLMLPDNIYFTRKNQYLITLGRPFEVTDKEDIEFFRNNHRFEEVGKPKKKYTEAELFALNKSEQIKILKELKADRIPRREKDRVKLILELQ